MNGQRVPSAVRRLVPERWRRRLRRWRHPLWFGTLRRTRPLSDHWGRERGTPVDRWYIERFLATHGAAITGRVLEVRDPGYVRRFGHDLASVDVLDIDAGNPRATIVADLAETGALAGRAFDAIVVTQVLQYVADVSAALANLVGALAPGGTLLVTVPGIGRVGRADGEIDRWRFTPAGVRLLLATAAPDARVSIETAGNVLSAITALAGGAADELRERELLLRDESFPVLILVSVVRPR